MFRGARSYAKAENSMTTLSSSGTIDAGTRRARLAVARVPAVWTLYLLAVSAPAAQVLAPKTNQPSRMNIGSAKVLRGKIRLIPVFVSGDSSKWSDQSKRAVAKKARAATAFLTSQAAGYGVEISFDHGRPYAATVAGTVPTDMKTNPAWTERVIKSVFGKDGNAVIRNEKKRAAADHAFFFLYVNKSATSYTLGFYRRIHPYLTAERGIIYARYADGRPTATASYAHEILHLFGMGELYFPYDKDDRRKKIARRLFPDDIMRRIDYTIDRLTIGSYTAYRVGWVGTMKPEHAVFEDPEEIIK